jgi:hypothetical protein
MIGLGLLMRFWPQLAGGLAVVTLLFGVYQAGVNAERKRGEAATLRVEIQTLRRDKAISDAALIRVADDAAELAAEAEQNERQIDALQDIIRNRADPGLTQLELDGLLNIR